MLPGTPDRLALKDRASFLAAECTFAAKVSKRTVGIVLRLFELLPSCSQAECFTVVKRNRS
jgi:hypothetical protein